MDVRLARVVNIKQYSQTFSSGSVLYTREASEDDQSHHVEEGAVVQRRIIARCVSNELVAGTFATFMPSKPITLIFGPSFTSFVISRIAQITAAKTYTV